MVDLRPARRTDLPGIHRVWRAADGSPEGRGEPNPWFAHVMRTGSMLVAVLEGEVVGFAGLRSIGDTAVISDCFVVPEHQGRRVGTDLLEALVPPDVPLMTFASADPRARALYRRFGLRPQWECHYLRGDPRPLSASPDLEEDPEFPVDDSDLPYLSELGCALVEASGGRGALTTRSVVSSWVPDERHARESLLAMVAWLAMRGGDSVAVQIAEAHPAFASLRGSGFEVGDSDLFMTTPGAAAPDPTRLTFNGDILRLAR